MSTQDQSQASGGEDLGDLDIDFTYEILPDDFLQYDLSFKIIVIGDSGVGKTALAYRIVKNEFMTKETKGGEYFQKISYFQGQTIKIDIYGTSGKEKYQKISKYLYKDAKSIIIIINNFFFFFIIHHYQENESFDLCLYPILGYTPLSSFKLSTNTSTS